MISNKEMLGMLATEARVGDNGGCVDSRGYSHQIENERRGAEIIDNSSFRCELQCIRHRDGTYQWDD